MTDLPRPEVEVSHGAQGGGDSGAASETVNVTIKRGSATRSYEATAPTRDQAVKGVVEQIINDPYTAEFLPEVKKPTL
jgi:hypothetical protein